MTICKWIHKLQKMMIAFLISEHPLSSPLDLFDKSHFSAWRWRWEEKFVMICFIIFCWLARGSNWKRLQSIFCNRQDYRRTCFNYLISRHFQMVFFIFLFFFSHNIASSWQSKLRLFWQGKRKFSRRLESKRELTALPEHTWYSGICFTAGRWRLSGSRQLHKAPAMKMVFYNFNYTVIFVCDASLKIN